LFNHKLIVALAAHKILVKRWGFTGLGDFIPAMLKPIFSNRV